MEYQEKVDLLTAMMLLETGLDGMNQEFGSLQDLAVAAHSFIQVAVFGRHSSETAAEFVAAIKAKTAIRDAMNHDN